jgi:predicted transcriptional regulator
MGLPILQRQILLALRSGRAMRAADIRSALGRTNAKQGEVARAMQRLVHHGFINASYRSVRFPNGGMRYSLAADWVLNLVDLPNRLSRR